MNKAQYQGLASGGLRSRDYANLGMRAGFSGAADYCIDAPSYMPAGSVENINTVNWRGRPIIAQREIMRGEAA
jgi:hypothetical protein